ncbi:MAG: restriction endonuclease subunit S [Gammaproteobacteria bacterium]|nr:restriction endonuclease subunit S [Gammaproteobacteria bacterium]MCY4339204.1 restriction endonuclease subunit S [Gammaproteobacteria bacterium]
MNVFSNAFTNASDLRSVNVGSDESQNAVVKGDVFFTVSSETPEEAGMSSVLLEEIENCCLNSFCALFRFNDEKRWNPIFLGYLLRSTLARAHLSRGAQGATRYNISKETFRSLPLQLPLFFEQQKIADCLGSLDDLIVAAGQKLEALRQHKQGLQQQLFPSLKEVDA